MQDMEMFGLEKCLGSFIPCIPQYRNISSHIDIRIPLNTRSGSATNRPFSMN